MNFSYWIDNIVAYLAEKGPFAATYCCASEIADNYKSVFLADREIIQLNLRTVQVPGR